MKGENGFLVLYFSAGNEVIKGGRNDKAINKVDNMMELLVYVSVNWFSEEKGH